MILVELHNYTTRNTRYTRNLLIHRNTNTHCAHQIYITREIHHFHVPWKRLRKIHGKYTVCSKYFWCVPGIYITHQQCTCKSEVRVGRVCFCLIPLNYTGSTRCTSDKIHHFDTEITCVFLVHFLSRCRPGGLYIRNTPETNGNDTGITVEYTGNRSKIHWKYTDYTRTVHGINVLLHTHFFYTVHFSASIAIK